jgi:hypothetical protein
MALALRPAVLLMALASALFFVAGALDGIYPGGPAWSFDAYGGLGWTSYAFGLVNAAVALQIARGSERMLVSRVGIAFVFVIERAVSAFLPTPKGDASIAVHLITAGLEALILLTTFRVWRMGRVSAAELSLLTMPEPRRPS